MASKSKPVERAAWEVDFVHIELSSADKEALKTWDSDYSRTNEVIQNLCLAGWKLSVMHDGKNDAFISSLTSPKVAAPGHQKCLSSRGPDFLCSLRVSAYKVVVILDGDLESLADIAETRSQWG